MLGAGTHSRTCALSKQSSTAPGNYVTIRLKTTIKPTSPPGRHTLIGIQSTTPKDHDPWGRIPGAIVRMVLQNVPNRYRLHQQRWVVLPHPWNSSPKVLTIFLPIAEWYNDLRHWRLNIPRMHTVLSCLHHHPTNHHTTNCARLDFQHDSTIGIHREVSKVGDPYQVTFSVSSP